MIRFHNYLVNHQPLTGSVSGPDRRTPLSLSLSRSVFVCLSLSSLALSLSVCLSLSSLVLSLSVCLSFCLCLSVRLSLSLSVCVSLSPSLVLSLSVCLPPPPSRSVSVCLPPLSLSRSVSLFLPSLSPVLSLSVCLSVCLSVSPPLSPSVPASAFAFSQGSWLLASCTCAQLCQSFQRCFRLGSWPAWQSLSEPSRRKHKAHTHSPSRSWEMGFVSSTIRTFNAPARLTNSYKSELPSAATQVFCCCACVTSFER